MQKISLLAYLFILSVATCYGVDIPKGTFYFDNSLTKYEQVKFVYGSDVAGETWVVSMQIEEGAKWSITFDETVRDMYRYTFANTTLPDGKISDSFTNVKNDISNNRGEYRTATTDATILVGATYTPTSGDNWAQGAWKIETEGNGYSGALPVMFINTVGNQAIVSKEEYIDATYYVDAFGLEGYDSFGSENEPLPLEIRGRGNYTWRDFDKKPYRIKLGSKAALLGMKKSKHFALLAHADDNLGFYRNTMGFEFSRRIGMAYTPAQEPVEVVLNGDYIGLYFLTETIRVDEDRVDIVEQADEATDLQEITGGWLLEIDNYEEAEQIGITEGDGTYMRFTYKTPEKLSDAQRTYLIDQMQAIDDAIYVDDANSTEWENLVDMDALVRFYIVQEIMQNAESFNGSCYLYKEQGENEKWFFGPVWDFGNSFHNGEHRFIYVNPPFYCHWIHQFAEFVRFQQHVINVWNELYNNQLLDVDDFMNDFADKIATAAVYDYARWPQYGNADIYAKKKSMKDNLDSRIAWLHSQWEDSSVENINSADNQIKVVGSSIVVPENSSVYDINGNKVNPVDLQRGIYIVKLEERVIKIAIR